MRAPASIKGLLEVRGWMSRHPCEHVSRSPAVKLAAKARACPRPLLPCAHSLKRAAKVPQIALDGSFASTPAKIRAALAAFSKGLFRDTFVPK